jgi:5-methyltetrahydrofolate--homocysteine methyltransferase
VAMSALLTTTMPEMKTTIDALKTAGVRDKVKVLVGGAPITQKYADEIGADGYSDNAVGAVALARKTIAA